MLMEEAVDNGIKILNEKCKGWVDKVDLETYHADGEKNLLVQLYGSYGKGMDILKLIKHPGGNGFNLLDIQVEGGNYSVAWNNLTDMWKDKITELRNPKRSILNPFKGV